MNVITGERAYDAIIQIIIEKDFVWGKKPGIFFLAITNLQFLLNLSTAIKITRKLTFSVLFSILLSQYFNSGPSLLLLKSVDVSLLFFGV